MPELKIGDPVVYCPLASAGHYRGKVALARSPGVVDVELEKDDTGPGDAVTLSHIAVVASLRDLAPGTCTGAPA